MNGFFQLNPHPHYHLHASLTDRGSPCRISGNSLLTSLPASGPTSSRIASLLLLSFFPLKQPVPDHVGVLEEATVCGLHVLVIHHVQLAV